LRRIELKRYNGQWANRGLIARLHRKLSRAIAQGECVLLDGEDVVGLELEDLQALVAGLPEDKIRLAGFSSQRLFPLPGGRVPRNN
jgi:hypothetical protein